MLYYNLLVLSISNMIEPPKEYQIIKNYIDKENMSLSGYIYFLTKIPKKFYRMVN